MTEKRKRRKRRKELTEQIKESAKKPVESPTTVEFIGSGCIPLNLAASGKGAEGGWARGRIINLVGDGSSGKTLLAIEAAAWVFYNIQKIKSKIFKPVEKVNIVYNNIEGVMDFPLHSMYGKSFYESIEWIQSPTAQAFGRDFLSRVKELKSGEFLLYILDSIDALLSEEADERIEKSIEKDVPIDGSYGVETQKFFSQAFFKKLCKEMEGKDATLIIINQIRENLHAGVFGKKYRRTGGKALNFYTHQVVWLYEMEKMQRQFRGSKRTYGIKVKAKLERNKTAKPFREAEFKILFDYGVDDIGSMIDYLFGPKNKEVKFNDEKFKDYEELLEQAEASEELYKELVAVTEKDWKEIEEEIKPKRKRKYE